MGNVDGRVGNDVDVGRRTLMLFGVDLCTVGEVYEMVQLCNRYRSLPRFQREILSIRRIAQPDGRVRFEIDVVSDRCRDAFRALGRLSIQHDWLIRYKRDTWFPRANGRIQTRSLGRRDITSLRFVTLNVNGLANRKELLHEYMIDIRADVVCLQETLRDEDQFRLQLPGYQVREIRSGRGVAKRGLAIAVSEALSAHPVGDSSPFYMFIRLFGVRLACPIIVGNVYLPGNRCKDRESYRNATLGLKSQVKRLRRHYPNDPMFIMGDYNRIPEVVSRLARRLTKLLRVTPEGDPATFHRGERLGTPDHMLVSEQHVSWASSCHVDTSCDISDHYPIISEFSVLTCREQSVTTSKQVWDRHPSDEVKTAFACHNYFQSLEIEDNDNGNGENLEVMATQFTDACRRAATDLGYMKVKITKLGGGNKHVFKIVDDRYRAAVRRQRQLYYEWKTCPTVIGGIEAERVYKEHRKLTGKLAREAKQKARVSSTEKAMGLLKNPRDLWSWAAKQAGLKTRAQGPKFQPVCDSNGILKTSVEDVNEVWLHHYRTLFEDPTGHSKDPEYWKTIIEPEVTDVSDVPELGGLNHPLELPELKQVLQSLAKYKASGGDDIPGEVWKSLADEESEEHCPIGFRKFFILCKIALASDIVPACWSSSLIVTIFKKGDPTRVDNYRGISLMQTILKVVCTVAARRISAAFERFGLFAKEQAGFRSKEECMGQCVALYEVARRRLNGIGKVAGSRVSAPTYALFLDQKKAYDMVPHEALFRKLELKGVRGSTLRFIKALYHSSTCSVRNNDGSGSEQFPLLRGLRQGCPLSPVLFNIFINDIFDTIPTHCQVSVPMGNGATYHVRKIPGLLFADDAVVLAPSPNTLKRAYRVVKAWVMKHEMALGVKKCGIMKFVDSSKTEADSMQEARDEFNCLEPGGFFFDGEEIPIVSRYTYLGVVFTGNLCRRSMVEARMEKGIKAIGAMRSFLRGSDIPLHIRLMIIKGCVVPSFMYGCELWGMGHNKLDKLVDTKVNHALRHIIGHRGALSRTPVFALRVELGIDQCCVTSGKRRLGAFGKFPRLRTWVSDMVKHPHRTRRRNWATYAEYWLNKSNLGRKVGMSSRDNGAGFHANLTEMRDKLCIRLKEREEVAALKVVSSLHWYLQGKFMSVLGIPYSAILGRGIQLIIKLRIGAYWTGRSLYNQRIPGCDLMHSHCPFCNANPPSGEGETIAHLLVSCPTWSRLRNRFLGAYLTTWRGVLSPRYTNNALERILAQLILGGDLLEVGHREDWVRGSRVPFTDEVVLIHLEGGPRRGLTNITNPVQVDAWTLNLDLMGLGMRTAAFVMAVDKERTRRRETLPDGTWRINGGVPLR